MSLHDDHINEPPSPPQDLSASGLTIPSDSEPYSSLSPPSSSPPQSSNNNGERPVIIYQPPTFWSLLRGAAINLLLPFVNGLMLGFGELFAHEFAFRLGWSQTNVSEVDWIWTLLTHLGISIRSVEKKHWAWSWDEGRSSGKKKKKRNNRSRPYGCYVTWVTEGSTTSSMILLPEISKYLYASMASALQKEKKGSGYGRAGGSEMHTTDLAMILAGWHGTSATMSNCWDMTRTAFSFESGTPKNVDKFKALSPFPTVEPQSLCIDGQPERSIASLRRLQ